ncbi:MAG TPA: hypothetical protein VGJ41_08275 [Nocardioides sp.]
MNARRSILLTVFVAGVCAVLSGALWQLGSGPTQATSETITRSTSPSAVTRHADRTQQTQALTILRAWDARRAQAWAAGDVAGLRRLYTSGSVSGASDCADLQRYVDRGLVVEGMTTQILAASVVTFEPEHVVLDVTDRLAASTAVGDGGRFKLPGTQAQALTVELVRQHGVWLVRENR